MGRPAGTWLIASCALALGIATFSPGAAIAVSSPTAALAQACGKSAARSTVDSFVAAFNHGAFEQLDALFAPTPAFQWYSQNAPGKRLGGTARGRSTLIGYFRARHTAGDRLGIVSFQANTGDQRSRNFSLVMRRSVPGFRHGDWFRLDAKGAIECSRGNVALIVLSLGSPKGSEARAQARS